MTRRHSSALATRLAGVALAVASWGLVSPDPARAGAGAPESAAAPAAERRWLEVRIDDAGDGTRVRLRVPASVVESLAPLLDAASLRGSSRGHGSRRHLRFDFDGDRLDERDLRRLAATARGLGDGQSAELEFEDGDRAVVGRAGARLRLRFEEEGRNDARGWPRRGETVTIEVPYAAFEALVRSGGGEGAIEPGEALRALVAGSGEVLRIDAEDTTVSVSVESGWRDER